MNDRSNPTYKLAVFDIDGTLIDTERTGVLSLMRTISELMGIDMPYEKAYNYFGIPSAKVAGMLGYSGDADFGDRWEQNFIALAHLITPFPGVLEMMSAVRKAGIKTGIVTSRSRFELEYDKMLAKMLHCFDEVVCAEDTQHHKPSPDPLLECIRRVSERCGQPLSPADCLYLGDTEHDWKCACGAGCDFALADWKGRGAEGIDAKFVFSDAQGVLDILGCTGR